MTRGLHKARVLIFNWIKLVKHSDDKYEHYGGHTDVGIAGFASLSDLTFWLNCNRAGR